MSNAPMVYTWMGAGFAPLPRFVKMADQQFEVGKQYRIEIVEERSMVSHNHFFAAISEAWKTLPEQYGEQFATPDHLRRWALIKAGFHDERSIVCASKAEALRVAAFVRPMDEYAVVLVKESVVRVYTAKSQSMKAMGKKDFAASKQAVLEVLGKMLGVEADEIGKHAASRSQAA